MKTRSALPHVTHFKDRHGKVRWRYRRDGFAVSLGTDYGSEQFMQRLDAAQKGKRLPLRQDAPSVRSGSALGSLSAVIASWYRTTEFTTLSASTQYGYKKQAEGLRNLHGIKMVANMQRRHVKAIMAAKAHLPNAANHDRRILCFLLDHALDLELVEINVARSVKKLRVSDAGYHTWTEDEISAFLSKHASGSAALITLSLMLYTGAGRTDTTKMGPGNIIGGRLHYRRQKMATRGGVLVDIPIHPVLLTCLEPLMQKTTFLQTDYGKQRSPNGLGNSMRTWCDDAGLKNCSSHGLRKACARRLIEAGATPHEMMAITGHRTLAEAQRYADTFNRSSAADNAMGKYDGI